MDHSEVVRLQAAEKYVLGELPPDLREQFEEHYFDCGECAADVQHLTTFVTASRMVLEETSRAKQVTPAKQGERAGWFAWLRPMIALPALGALAAILIFQNLVTIPALKQRGVTDGATEIFSGSYRLQGATRGEGGSTITIGAKETFALDFDFTPALAYRMYIGKLVDSKGNTALSFTIDGGMANQELHVVVPAGRMQPGEYELVIAGDDAKEVQRIPFALAFRP